MKRKIHCLPAMIAAGIVLNVLSLFPNPKAGSSPCAIKAGRILTITRGIIENGVVLIRDGKIEKVGKGIPIPSGYKVIDASDGWLLPGFVDAHSHNGGEMGDGFNESVFSINTDVRSLDSAALDTPFLKRAVAGGVTAILFIPGSGSNIGGIGVIMKTAGETIDDVIVKYPAVLKFAQAGNPERQTTGEIGAGRMGMNWHIREVMNEAKAYYDERKTFHMSGKGKEPERIFRFEEIKGIFENKMPIFNHCAFFQPTQMVFRMHHDEFKFSWTVVTHGEFGAFRNGPALAKRIQDGTIYYDCGPRLYDYEGESFLGVVTEYAKGGVRPLSINTDSVFGGQEKLCLQAAMAVRLGIDDITALEGITINSARTLRVDDRLGSIEAGKDADLAIWTGNPLDVRSHTRLVMVNGRIVYDISKDGQRY